jgi:peptide-methionine (S)-S-oxide reductase
VNRLGQTPALVAIALLSASCAAPATAEEAVRAPLAKLVAREAPGTRTAIFAGGCFWGVEGVFSHVKGVKSAVSGYHGGSSTDANYAAVGSGRTGHAEVVRVRYDPAVIRYDQLLRIYFSVVADPTLVNRQGPDRGPQYRSALVPLDAEQRQVAEAYVAQLGKAGLWDRPIATKIEAYRGFHAAERYHQDYMLHHPDSGYIRVNDAPKVRALEALYPGVYKDGFTTG